MRFQTDTRIKPGNSISYTGRFLFSEVIVFLHRLFVEGRVHCGLTGLKRAGEKPGGACKTNA
jgi:hypothetical protein